jgi:hypothetical protein
MKEKEGYIDCPEQQVILYVEKEDGKFGPMQTGSYLTRNFLDDYEEKRKHLEDTLKAKISNREVSPIYYYMVLEDLTMSELAARVGIRKGKVRKHLGYISFNSIDEDVLQKYADVFNVNVQDLHQLINSSIDKT